MAIWLVVALAVFFAYIVFGMTGFGAATLLIPGLSFVLPIKLVVPLVGVLGFLAAITLSLKERRFTAKREILPMIPGMVLGVAVGVHYLVRLPSHWLLVGLGVVVLGFGLNGLRGDFAGRTVSRKLAFPVGLVGGVVGGLFGTEGSVFVMYLSRRVPGKFELRATIATVFILSGAARIVGYTVEGLFRQHHLLEWALALYPCMLSGIFVGNRLHRSLPVQQIRAGVQVLLIVSGLSILGHSFLA